MPAIWEGRAKLVHRQWRDFEARYRALWVPARGAERSFQLWIACSGPRRVRIEASGRMGGSWLTVIARGNRLLATLPRQREYILESASPGLLETLSGWPLEPGEYAGILLADLPARLGLSVAYGGSPGAPASPRRDSEGATEVVEQPPEGEHSARRYILARGPGGGGEGAVLRIESGEQLVAQVTYASWSRREGLPLPALLRLSDSRGRLELRLVELEAGASPEAFDLAPPEGFRRRPAPAREEEFQIWGAPEAGP